MTFGYVCIDCRMVYPACWYEPATCQCGAENWRKAKAGDVKQAIKELEELLAGDSNG